jgi:hypothetical protein
MFLETNREIKCKWINVETFYLPRTSNGLEGLKMEDFLSYLSFLLQEWGARGSVVG